MNTLNTLQIPLKRNYNFKGINFNYYPKTREELVNIIYDLIKNYNTHIIDLNTINVSIIKNFNYCFNRLNINFDISEWDVSNAQDFYNFIYQCKNFNSDLSRWSVSNGKNFESMFYDCESFNSNLSQWDVSNGINFSFMFYKCESFNTDLSNWNVFNGVDFKYMFFGCKSFNADLSKWNVSKSIYYDSFAKNSGLCKYLEKYPKRIPKKFRNDYL